MDAPKRILIVDDTESICKSLQLIFEHEGYETETAGTGQEALKKVQENPFNLILLDIKLPDVEGIELVTPLKELQPDMIVMLITGYAVLESAVRALHNGAVAYITKPFQMEEVLVKVREAIQKQILERERRRLTKELQNELAERKQMEKKLRNSEEQFRQFFENAPIYCYMISPEGVIREVNNDALKALGYQKEDLIGKPLDRFYHPDSLPKANRLFAKWKQIGELNNEELGIITKHGARRTILLSARAIRDPNEQIISSIFVQKDITERKQATEMLQKRTNTLTERVKELNCLYTISKLIERPGSAIEEILQGIVDHIPPAYQYPEITCARMTIEGQEFRSDPFSETHWKQVSSIKVDNTRIGALEVYYTEEKPESNEGPFLKEERRLINGIAKQVGTLITRKRAEEEVRKSEKKYHTLFEDTRDPIVIVTMEGQFIDVNPAAEKLFGYPRDELLQLNANDFYENPTDRLRYRQMIEERGASNDYEVQLRNKDGTVMDCLLNETVWKAKEGSIQGYQGIIRDITEQKRADKALLESEKMFRRTFDAIPDPAFLWKRHADSQIILTRANKSALNLGINYTLHDFLDREMGSIENIPHFIDIVPSIRHVLDTGETLQGHEMSFKHPYTKEKKWFLMDCTKTAEENLLLITKDITPLKQAEEMLTQARDHLTDQVAEKTKHLQEEKQRVETIIETIPDGILVFDIDGSLSLANKTIKDTYWNIYQEEFPVGYTCLNRDDNLIFQTIKRLFLAKKGESIVIEPIPDLHLQFFSAVTRISSEIPFGAIIEVRDISPFIRFDNLRKRFVSMVSHELRTPISAIAQSTSNLEKYQDRLSNAQKDQLLDIITRNAKLMTQLIEDLLLTSRIDEQQLPTDRKKYRPLEILQTVLTQLESLRKIKTITVKVDVDEDIELLGDPKHIGQILRIFLDNALKYSNEKATILIEATDHYQGKYNPHGRDGIIIHFHDSGRGIREKDLPYLFDRFFRSEDVQQIPGTGLGLSIAQELTSLHQGEIFVESKLNQGTTFSVFLPRLTSHPKNPDINEQ